MTNRRLDPVSYKPFRAQPLLSEGLLSVSREGGDLERKVAAGLARMADDFGAQALQEAEKREASLSRKEALENAPGLIKISGGGYKESETSNGVRVKVPPAELRTMIADAAVRNGVDPHALTEVAGIESSFNPYARNKNSSAGGLFQFVDGTAKQYGLRDRFDPAQASDAAARLMRDNRDHLRKTLGREPNAGELYLAHQQGAGGASSCWQIPTP
ncbi:transglycosylase SLT domain-containing protein [Agrobacterium sp. LMR679]|uniref:transglycosylase SLT domain-containing protein n=1 Tax=Agrobacterium sp. LMR679 TaxID=3014335 RepID=UPI003FA4C9C8